MARTKEELAAYQKEYRKKNKDRLREFHKRRELKRKNDPIHQNQKRNAMYKRKYGITLDDYNRMLQEQNETCKICYRDPAKGKRLHVDHCHETKMVRGLLCAECNWYVGKIDRNSDVLWNIYAYMEETSVKRWEKIRSEQGPDGSDSTSIS